jgi:DNA-binding FadR family transcriptional regulator
VAENGKSVIPADADTPFRRIKGQRLSGLVEKQIKDAFFTGQLHVGDKLPSDRELALLCGASRPVIREALRSLEAKGLLTVKTGMRGGAFLTPISSKPVMESFQAMLSIGQLDHGDILQARLIIEPQVAAEAARKYSAKYEALLDECSRVLEEGFKTGDVFLEHNPNPNLHRVIAEMTGNPLIILIMDILMDKTVKRQATVKLDAEAQRAVDAGHKDIIAALKRNDWAAAEETMKAHVMSVYTIHKTLEAKSRAGGKEQKP